MRRPLMLGLAAAALAMSGAAIAGDGSDHDGRKHGHSMEWKSPLANMSPQGAAIIGEAMKRERIPANAEDVRRARQRVLDLIASDPLDIKAIRKAQAKERELAFKEHALAQEKMLRAYQRLSVEDRRAFAEGMRLQDERMIRHLKRARDRMQRMQEQMHRDMERMRKETGSLWIIVPVAPEGGQG